MHETGLHTGRRSPCSPAGARSRRSPPDLSDSNWHITWLQAARAAPQGTGTMVAPRPAAARRLVAAGRVCRSLSQSLQASKGWALLLLCCRWWLVVVVVVVVVGGGGGGCWCYCWQQQWGCFGSQKPSLPPCPRRCWSAGATVSRRQLHDASRLPGQPGSLQEAIIGAGHARLAANGGRPGRRSRGHASDVWW
jgi:hypothetical protein